MKRILIACPVRQDLGILKEYLRALDRLEIPEDVTVDKYFLVNNCPEAEELFKEMGIEYDTLDSYTDYKPHYWDTNSLNTIAWLRERCLWVAEDRGYDYIWFIDSDVIVQPTTLKVLLAADKPLISEIYWSVPNNGVGYFINGASYIMEGPFSHEDIRPLVQEKLENDYKQFKIPGTYEIGYTGACFLISMEVIKAGAHYACWPSHITYNYYGEDRAFCLMAAFLGYTSYINTECPALHLMTKNLFDLYVNNRDLIEANYPAIPDQFQ